MSAESKPDLQLQLAHILFIDVVGYSRLLVNEQVEMMQELNRIVRGTECFRAAERDGKLIRVPTGDGMALLFLQSPEEPVRCAMEISRALKAGTKTQVRMGAHSGPVNQVTDVNDQLNVAGAGINVAQRVMECGDAGHILLSKHLADDLTHYRQWQPFLHDLGECEVKHGLRLKIVNLYKDGLGNAAVPEKLRRRWKPAAPAIRPIRRRWPKVVLLAALLLCGAALIAGLYSLFRHSSPHSERVLSETLVNPATPIPEKSIAVLPFENLSDDKQNTYFADAVQDEILTDLSKVADLKVISRTSVMQYRNSVNRNLREIAKALGVAHVLEGTVQRSGDRVRVNAQLIDARSDAHLWGEKYDREVADVFAIENELSEQIVAQLKSKLSTQEKAAIEQKPTNDLAAYDLYERAKTLIDNSPINLPLHESLVEAIRLLNQALERDPTFALAYYQLAHAHDLIYFAGADHTPARLAMADAAIQALQQLKPNSGETHLAMAKHYYWGYFDYDRARVEIELAKESLPNDPLPFLLAGYIDRRQSRWEQSTKNFERAVELDPRNPFVLEQIQRSYICLRRYADAKRALDLAISLAPAETGLRTSRGEVELYWHADTRPLNSIIKAILAENPHAPQNIAEEWLNLSLCQRDIDGAQRALAALPLVGCHVETIPFPRSWCEGLVAQMMGNTEAAQNAFISARAEAAKLVEQQPSYAEAICVLGLADAVLGHKEDAIREGRHAVELLPVAKDSIVGALLIQNLAIIYAWTGERNLAFDQLRTAAGMPGYLSYGQLRLHPYFDSLRGDPRFDEIVDTLAPKN